MHIHPNNNLLLASLGAARDETQEVQAKRAAEVRRRLSTASRAIDFSDDEYSGAASRVERRSYESQGHEAQGQEQPPSGEEDGFGRLFSAKA